MGEVSVLAVRWRAGEALGAARLAVKDLLVGRDFGTLVVRALGRISDFEGLITVYGLNCSSQGKREKG